MNTPRAYPSLQPSPPQRPPPRPALPAASSPEAAARERLVSVGADACSTAELLTVLLAPGGRPRRAESGARRLMLRFGRLKEVASARPAELHRTAGVSPVLAARLAAAFALGRRVHAEVLGPGRMLSRSAEIFDAFDGRLRHLRKERFISVLLDGRNRVIREDLVSEGILTASLVHPREVFAPAIREAAGGILLVHNHPSGDPEPSPEDVEITHRLCAVGELVGIRVLDHVVIGDGCYVSFLERGMLP